MLNVGILTRKAALARLDRDALPFADTAGRDGRRTGYRLFQPRNDPHAGRLPLPDGGPPRALAHQAASRLARADAAVLLQPDARLLRRFADDAPLSGLPRHVLP